MIITVTPNPVLDRTLTVPRIVLDEMARATEVREDWGGKGFNVSRALLALGAETLAMGFVGGAIGARLERELRSLGIGTDLVTLTQETRTNVIIVDAQGAHYIKVNEAGPEVEPGKLAELFDRVRERAREGQLWALCGSLPPGVPASFYAELVVLLRKQGARALLDTSGEALRLGIEAQPFAVKPNQAEIEALTGQSITDASTAASVSRSLLKGSTAIVALSLGADGLLLATPRGSVHAWPPRVHAPNPVGAGDALVAGLLYAVERQLPPAAQARWAVAAGTAAAMREGVSVGTRAEVEALYAQVTIEETPY